MTLTVEWTALNPAGLSKECDGLDFLCLPGNTSNFSVLARSTAARAWLNVLAILWMTIPRFDLASIVLQI